MKLPLSLLRALAFRAPPQDAGPQPPTPPAPPPSGRGARRDRRRGNVAIMTALMMMPISVAVGMGYDYSMAQSRHDEISGMADAAALAAVTPSMMLKSASQSAALARQIFANQIASVAGISYAPSNISVTAADVTSATTVTRNVTVKFTAESNNAFASLLGVSGFPIGISSTATSNNTPNINFYVLLDNSPSMEIAATTNGINTMVANTGAQGGCAFGCHEMDPAADRLGNPNGEDNYALARSLGVALRIDLVNAATQNLMSVAQATENGNGAKYQAAIYSFNLSVSRLQALTSNLSQAQSSAANLAALEVYNNNCLTQTNCNNDQDTSVDGALSIMNTIMPKPGNGTNAKGDTPQEVLFIVSDGVNDTSMSSFPGSPDTTSGGGRVYGPVNTLGTDWCTAIKNRGIRIAFLYTTYNPLPTNSWYNNYVSPFQSDVATQAANCASPGLFYEVNTDGDISAALASLFQKAVATARLTQ